MHRSVMFLVLEKSNQ